VEGQATSATLIAIVADLFLGTMSAVFGVIDIEPDDLGWPGGGRKHLLQQHQRQAIHRSAGDAVGNACYRRLGGPGGPRVGPPVTEECAAGIVAHGVGSVRLCIASGHWQAPWCA
jgi:hypothetical protein